jgi:tetratricopeptide (TPR) repeat protein
VQKLWIKTVVCCSTLCLSAGVVFPQQSDVLESLLASAQQAQARSDFQAAAEFYRQAVALHPEIPELRANLGLMYYQTGNNEQAAEAFRQAIRLKPALFVPNLFLGLEYVKLKQFNEAIPYLKRAALSKPTDVQAQLDLGQAYVSIGNTRLALSAYSRATQLSPEDADVWYHLGLTYLEEVEADARVLLARHKDSAYLQALIADTFSEQRAFIQAGDAYKAALALSKYPFGTHAAYAFALLNRNDLPAAESELNAELASTPGSLPAKLGLARLHVEQGAAAQATKEIERIWEADAGFLRANAARFNDGLAQPKLSELQRVFEQGLNAGEISEDVVAVVRSGGSYDAPRLKPAALNADMPARSTKTSLANASELYSSGKYRECTDLLASRLQFLQVKDLRFLTSCAYSTGDYRNAFDAAEKLTTNTSTEAVGLYWETKSAQKLASEALSRASELDSSSPKLHVLLGDLYRQRECLPDAEKEYRKALELKPEDIGALFGLSLTLLADQQTDEAFRLAQAALQNSVDDSELNSLMGEILCARHQYSEAEPYLKKGLNTKLDLAPHVHALLGKVYAETDRTQQAIAELKLGLADDKDGSLHYQIARLYLKVGNRDLATQAFEMSDRMHREELTRASVALQQGGINIETQ